MTEEEAKKKWCPMVRFSPLNRDDNTYYSTTTREGGGNCIGSDCMMWKRTYENTTNGYCGLGGGK